MAWLLELDRQAFLAINGWNSPFFDGVMWWVSGKVTWWPFYLAVLLFLGWKKRWGLVPLLVFVVLVIVATDQTSVHLFKNVFHRLRPCHEPLLGGWSTWCTESAAGPGALSPPTLPIPAEWPCCSPFTGERNGLPP
ncbi:MAG: hypothetical protein R2751_13975 [Bacteroidales bacterium]